MFEPTSILAAGDWHGDAQHAAWTLARALKDEVQAIIQLGDFGFWEHAPGGPEFLDWLGEMAVCNAMPIYWVDGNHENHTQLRQRYGPGGDRHKPTPDGFWQIRDGLFHVSRGTRWTWNGVRMMGLGGAYSVDKTWRIERSIRLFRAAEKKNQYRRAAGKAAQPLNKADYALWWPEEELTENEIGSAIGTAEPIDVLFTHDKPRASDPRWNRKNLPLCLPNQDRIQTVVNTLHPALLVHGHLHHRYTDHIRCGDNDQWCRVEGLGCNPDASDPPMHPRNSVLRIELDKEAIHLNGTCP